MMLQELRRRLPFVVGLMLLPFVELHIVRLAFVTFDKTVASIASATSAAFT